ncbi:MAG: GntR family transcriptional regulator [Holophaga sp.]|jgi:DNA-binding GntR family transcriptional regulator
MAAGINDQPRESTTVDRVVMALRQSMFEGRLNPGTQLREEMLSTRFGVSRSTVREALRVLTVDGLMRREPNRSVIVRHLTVAEVEDIFRARMLLEGACVRAAATCPDQSLQQLAGALEAYVAEMMTNDHPRAAEAHVEFHAAMVRILSGSQWLAETERSMLRQLLLILATVHMSGEDLRHEIQYHVDLCCLCTARRIEPALRCLKEGLDDSRTFAIKFTFEALELAKSQGETSWLEPKA